MSFIKKISTTEPDDLLVSRYKESGNMNLLGELYQRYLDLVYGVCLKYMKEPEDAKDCVLSIFEELVTKLRKHPVEHFKAWLYQLSKNHCLMKLRKQKSQPINIELSDVHLYENDHPILEFDKEANLVQLEYCLGQLPMQQKQVIELFYMQNKCYKEIAISSGLDVNSIRSFIQNGRRNLKICIEKKMEKLNG